MNIKERIEAAKVKMRGLTEENNKIIQDAQRIAGENSAEILRLEGEIRVLQGMEPSEAAK